MNHSKEKSSFRTIVAVVMILEALVLSGVIVYLAVDRNMEASNSGISTVLDYEDAESGKYVLYIGLNDKDTYAQIIPTEEARDIVNGICTKYADGYTVSEANGGWIDETGTLTEEMSLVYTLSGVEEEDIISIMDEVLIALNQNSILVERQDYSYTYYSGK